MRYALDKTKRVANGKNNISINEIVEATIINITFFGVSLKLEGLDIKASIFINELTDKPINSINDVRYNGQKLRIGQKLSAKVYNVDEYGRMHLSLKRMQSEK